MPRQRRENANSQHNRVSSRFGHGHHYAQAETDDVKNLGTYTTKNGRTVTLKVTTGSNDIALEWHDGVVDLFEVDAVDVFVDLFIDAIEYARGTPQNIPLNIRGTEEQRRARLINLLNLYRTWESRFRLIRKRIEEMV